MNKFIDSKQPSKAKPKEKEKQLLENVEVIKECGQEFIVCPKCGWKHALTEENCRFCGQILRG
jgi:ribosomal protein L40E